MAYLHPKTSKIVYQKDEPSRRHPGWVWHDCGCCNGIEWGGEEPRECRSCNGTGSVAVHKRSGIIVLYPGGKFLGPEYPPCRNPVYI